MQSKKIKGAKEIEINVRFEAIDEELKINRTYEYDIEGDTLYIKNGCAFYSATFLKKTEDIVELIGAGKDNTLLRLDNLNKNIGYLTLLVFNKQITIDEPFSIVLDEDAYRDILRIYPDKNYLGTVNFLNQEFIYKANDRRYCFAFPSNQTDGELNLVGDHVCCTVTRTAQNYFHVEKLYKKKNFNELVNILTGDVAFQTNKEVIKRNSEQFNEKFNELAKSNVMLLNLWRIYDELDQEAQKRDAEDLGFLKYTSYHRLGNDIVFKLDDSYVPSSFLQDEMQYAAIPTSEFNPSDPVGYDPRSTITIGSDFRKDCKNTPDFIIGDDMVDDSKSIPPKGYIIPSLNGSIIQSKRRKKAQRRIYGKECPLVGLKLLIENGDCVGPIGKKRKAVTESLNKHMFGNSGRTFNDRQKEAIEIAINTPDVAVIQGPPGTGKTQVIKAIIERINEIYDGKAKILITSTQHDAVDNASIGVDYSGVPVNRVTNRKKSVNEGFPIYKWIDRMINNCSDWLENHTIENEYQCIEDKLALLTDKTIDKYSYNKELYDLERLLVKKGFDSDVIKFLDETKRKISEELDNSTGFSDDDEILEILDKQGTNKTDFLKDNKKAFKELKFFIDNKNREEDFFTIPQYWWRLRKATPTTDDLNEMLVEFGKDLIRIRQIIEQKECAPKKSEFDFHGCIVNLVDKIHEYISTHPAKDPNELLYRCVWQFNHELTNISYVEDLITAYSKVNAATCQQAASRTINTSMKGFDEVYDYVIIDEAARSNPLDLIIPMSMGKKIILVGDHKQLPHMVERDIVQAVVDRTKKPDAYQVLEQSLFMRLFQNIKKIDEANRLDPTININITRTCILNEQYRMHPEICDLINVFYSQEHLISGCTAEEKSNNLSCYDKKPIVWLDVPINDRHEGETKAISKYRQAEVDVIQKELEKILTLNDSYNIGVITFYRKQASLLEDMVDKEYPNERSRISVGTVDAFQGKEFDVVLLSTVRANSEKDKKKRVGFLDNNNRLCVAFSRAKRVLIAVGDSGTVAINEDTVIIESLNELYMRSKHENGFYKIV